MISFLFTIAMQLSVSEPPSTIEPAATVAPATPNGEPASHDGRSPNEIKLIMDEAISTKTHVKGDTFTLLATEEFTLDGVTVPKQTRIVGEITRAQEKGGFGISGKLEARILYAVLPDRYLRIDGVLSAKGGGNAEGAAANVVGMGAGLFFVTGRSAIIEKGTTVFGIIRPTGK